MQLSVRSVVGTIVGLDEPNSRVRDRVPLPLVILVGRDRDAMERRISTSRVSEGIPLADVVRRPGDMGGTTLLAASGQGDDTVEVRVGLDLQVRRRVCDLIDDVGLFE